MNRNTDKGFTLIELISAIAMLSIVAFSAFTLLMFSIRSNNVIVTGASAAQDADLLNKRLELCFADAVLTGDVNVNGNGNGNGVLLDAIDFSDGKKLRFAENVLYFGNGSDDDEILQDNLQSFEIMKVNGTDLIRVSYTIGERNFVKLFRLNTAAE